MKQTTNSIYLRIEWCQRQSAQARTEPEMDGWRAEADGLRDALMNIDHTDSYCLCPPEILRRYVQGFQDGTALRRVARAQCMIQIATPATSRPESWMGGDLLLGGDR
ncbi:MAG: hypothetical protein P0120_16705 [Nitrospira sp.]|nr:hypothetical protein [Nitrospira sp.]